MADKKYLNHTENLPFFGCIVPYVTTDCNQRLPEKAPFTQGRLRTVGKSYISIGDDEKSTFEQRSKHRQNRHKNSATSIVAAIADMGG